MEAITNYLLSAMEFGYRACEKGLNFEKAREEFLEAINKNKP